MTIGNPKIPAFQITWQHTCCITLSNPFIKIKYFTFAKLTTIIKLGIKGCDITNSNLSSAGHQSYNYKRLISIQNYRSSHRRCSVKKGVIGNFANFTGKNQYQRLFFNQVPGGLCKISKNTFFTEHLRATVSEIL